MNIRLDNTDVQAFRSVLLPLPSSPLRDGLVPLLGGLKFSNGQVELNQKVLGPLGASLVINLSSIDGALLIDIKSAKVGVGGLSSGFFGAVRKKAGDLLLKYLNIPEYLSAVKVDGNIRLYVGGLRISSVLMAGEVLQIQTLLE